MVELWRIEDEPDGRRAILAQAARHCDTSPPASTLTCSLQTTRLHALELHKVKAKRWKDERMWRNEMLKTEFDWTEEALSLSENAPT